MHISASFAFAITLLSSGRSIAQTSTIAENPIYSAAVTGFMTSPGANGKRYVTVNLHIQNKTNKPLILGAARGKVTSSDDQQNRYSTIAMRGIGEIRGDGVDSKFELPAKGGGDILFELVTAIPRNGSIGTIFDFHLAAQEMEPLASGQVKLGTERSMDFTGLKTNMADPLPDMTADAGPFRAHIVRSKIGVTANRRLQTIDFTINFTNTSAKNLILGYESTSSFGVDDQGLRYTYGRPGTHDTSFSGIGLLTAAAADPQFALEPGESRNARFTVIRDLGREIAGTSMTFYLSLQGLEILPSGQIRSVRQYSLAFPGVSTKN